MIYILVPLLFKKFIPDTENQFQEIINGTHLYHSHDISLLADEKIMKARIYDSLLKKYSKDDLIAAGIYTSDDLKIIVSEEI